MSDDEWAFPAPDLALIAANAGQRVYDLREVLNPPRWEVKSVRPLRLMPHNFPSWPAVHQQARRWLAAGCFDDMAGPSRMTVADLADEPLALLAARVLHPLDRRGLLQGGRRRAADDR